MKFYPGGIKYPRKFYPGGIKYPRKFYPGGIKYPRKFYPGGIEYTIWPDRNSGEYHKDRNELHRAGCTTSPIGSTLIAPRCVHVSVTHMSVYLAFPNEVSMGVAEEPTMTWTKGICRRQFASFPTNEPNPRRCKDDPVALTKAVCQGKVASEHDRYLLLDIPFVGSSSAFPPPLRSG